MRPVHDRDEGSGPLFIGGTGRCGTTVLVRFLGLHPAIRAVRWETQFLVAPQGLLRLAERGWRPRLVDAFIDKFTGRWYRRTLNPGRDNEYVAGLFADVTEQEVEAAVAHLRARLAAGGPHDSLVREFVEHTFRGMTQRAGASVWCEKTPRNLLLADRLAAELPGMRFIHIVRDGRDVAASMLNRGFWPIGPGYEFPTLSEYRSRMTLEGAASYWRDVLELGARARAAVPPAHYLEIRFEDFIEQPEVFLENFCRFAGLPYDEAPLQLDLGRHNIGRWKDELSVRQVEAFMARAGSMMARYGYDGDA